MQSQQVRKILNEASALFYSAEPGQRTDGIAHIEAALNTTGIASQERGHLEKVLNSWKRALDTESSPHEVESHRDGEHFFERFLFYKIHGEDEKSLTAILEYIPYCAPGSARLQYALSGLVDAAMTSHDILLATVAANLTYFHLSFLEIKTKPSTPQTEDRAVLPIELGLPIGTAIVASSTHSDPVWRKILERFLAESEEHFEGREDLVSGLRERATLALISAQ